MPQPPRYPNVIFFDPNKTDRGLIEYWSTETGDYTPLDLGSPHENTRDYLGFRLGIQQALPDNQAWIKRVWVSDETNPNWFNYELKLASESVTFPTYVRTYRENKKTYTPKAKGIPLDTVIKLTLVNPGTGYTPGTFPALAFSAGAAVGHAIVNLDGTIWSWIMVAHRTQPLPRSP
jgi:hypothetical protein